MPVYVDDMQALFRRMVMCHMVADSTDELLAMADKIGVARKWLQHSGEGPFREHFDICLSKKSAAIRAGAQQITGREMALRRRAFLQARPFEEVLREHLHAVDSARAS